MKKLVFLFQTLFFGIITIFGFKKNYGSAYDGLTSNYASDDYSDYIGVVRKLSEMESTPVDQFSYTLTNTTGKNLNIGLTSPSLINTKRVVVPDASGQITANGGGLIDVGSSNAPVVLYDDVTKFADVKSVDAIIGDGIVEDATGDQVLYANVSSPSARLKITADNLPISYFINQMNDDKFIVDSIDIDVNDRSVITGSSILIKEVNCFNTLSERIIKLKDFINTKDLQDKRITIDTVSKYGFLLQLDRKSVVSLYMPGLVNGTALTTMSIQFNVKKVIDDAQMSINAAVKEYTVLRRTGRPTTKFQKVIQREEAKNMLNNQLIEQVLNNQAEE